MSIVLDRDHRRLDPHTVTVPVDPSLDGHPGCEAQWACAVESPFEGPAKLGTTPVVRPLDPQRFAELRLLAESFEDAQKARIAIENRLRSGADSGPVADALDALRHAETRLSLAMRRSFRVAAPEVSAWVKATPGIGEHLVARLIGTIGHPVIASPYHWEGEGSDRVLVADPPFVRNVAKLWAYCGHGDPNRKRRKGMSAEDGAALGNPRAKMLVHLLAESCIKCVGGPAKVGAPSDGLSPAAEIDLSRDHTQAGTPKGLVPTDLLGEGRGTSDAPECAALSDPSTDDANAASNANRGSRRRSPYRDVYDLGRLTYAGREDWTLAHQHNAALRLVGKAILRDLWLAAR